MNIPIKDKNNIPIPPVGYGYLFIDYESKELKCKKDKNSLVTAQRVFCCNIIKDIV